jgi:hypothetical protein
MKFQTRKTSNSYFTLAKMAQKANDAQTPSKDTKTVLTHQSTSWSALQLLVFTIFGALAATFLSSYHNHYPENSTVLSPSPSPQMTLSSSNVKILSLDPFIAHITDFVSKSEREHLIDLGYDYWHPESGRC